MPRRKVENAVKPAPVVFPEPAVIRNRSLEDVIVGVFRLVPNARLPVFARDGDACADVCAVQDGQIEPGKVEAVGLGIAVTIPDGFELVIRSRSSLPMKHKVVVANGVGTVDSHYTDEVRVLLLNLGDQPFVYRAGDRIAQVGLRRVPAVSFSEISLEQYKEAVKFSRGGGFGSTGTNIAELRK